MEEKNIYKTKSNKVEILRGTTDDAEGVQALVGEASKGMYRLCGWTEKEIDNHFNPEMIKGGADRLKEAITTFTEANILLVAKDGENKIVGCCFANKEDKINRIEAVYVMDDFQGTGLAKKIYDEAYQLLNSNNDTFLDVFSLNSKAINFYKKLGFSQTNTKHFDKKYVGSTGKPLEITEMVLSGKRSKI